MNCLIAFTANLAGMLLILSLMAFALARLSWHGRGTIAVLAMIILVGQFWMAPAMIASSLGSVRSPSYSIWFGNWLVSGFAVILLCQTVRWIPRQLEDTARLDGCGWFGTYWHVLLPLVRRELGFIALLTVMATSLPFFVFPSAWLVLLPVSSQVVGPRPGTVIGIIAGSLVMTLPAIVIFLCAKRYFLQSSKPTRLNG